MPSSPSLRAPCSHARLHSLATKPYEISGLVQVRLSTRRDSLHHGIPSLLRNQISLQCASEALLPFFVFQIRSRSAAVSARIYILRTDTTLKSSAAKIPNCRVSLTLRTVRYVAVRLPFLSSDPLVKMISGVIRVHCGTKIWIIRKNR